MKNNKYNLWTEEDMVVRGGSGKGTFDSCIPSIEYFKATSSAKSCIVICPGGGYTSKTMDYEGEEIAEFLNENGINAFVLDYRLHPDNHPAPLSDALKALSLAKSLAGELGYDKNKVGIMGFSAGGHLAASAGTMWTDEESRPDAMILAYPVITMGKYTHIGTKAALIGDSNNESIVDDLSCENRVDKRTPPAFIWHTVSDEAVPVMNSLLFANALAAKSIPFELHIYPEGEHGLGLAKDVPGACSWSKLCIDWLRNLGF